MGDSKKQCHCSSKQVDGYLEKLSGPLLDRIDLQISVQSIEYDTIKTKQTDAVSSEAMYKAVQNAVTIQQQRFNDPLMFNAFMTPELIEKHCVLSETAEELLKKAFDKLSLSMRGYHKILKVARTIADLQQSETITDRHIQEAIMYRSLDQNMERYKK